MKKFVQIVGNTAYWIFEAEELPPYPNPEDFLNITGRDDIQEGWDYNEETGAFTAPVVPDPTESEPVQTVEERLEQLELTAAHTQLQVDYIAFLTELNTTPQ